MFFFSEVRNDLPKRLRSQKVKQSGMASSIMDNRAFTLIEMIVVTALISIVLVVAIPRLDGGILTDDSDETSRWIIANVRHLKEKSVTDQKTYLLNVSFDTQRLWITHVEASEAEMEASQEEGHAIPQGITIDHVAYSESQRYSSGTVPLAFYPQGYSDKAVIRVKTSDGDWLSFFIEPFLPGVDLVKGNRGRR
jgi:general secretion pathway protein H